MENGFSVYRIDDTALDKFSLDAHQLQQQQRLRLLDILDQFVVNRTDEFDANIVEIAEMTAKLLPSGFVSTPRIDSQLTDFCNDDEETTKLSLINNKVDDNNNNNNNINNNNDNSNNYDNINNNTDIDNTNNENENENNNNKNNNNNINNIDNSTPFKKQQPQQKNQKRSAVKTFDPPIKPPSSRKNSLLSSTKKNKFLDSVLAVEGKKRTTSSIEKVQPVVKKPLAKRKYTARKTGTANTAGSLYDDNIYNEDDDDEYNNVPSLLNKTTK